MMNRTAKNHYCFYITDEQDRWLTDMAKLNNQSKSYFVRLAIDYLIEATGGIPNGI